MQLLVSAPAGEREFEESLDDVVVPKKNRGEKKKIAVRSEQKVAMSRGEREREREQIRRYLGDGS